MMLRRASATTRSDVATISPARRATLSPKRRRAKRTVTRTIPAAESFTGRRAAHSSSPNRDIDAATAQ